MADQIVDACCLINLYASGKIQEIIPACGGSFYVPQEVQNESLSIRQPDPSDSAILIPVPIDLSEAISQGLIQGCQLAGAAENESYVEFASYLDDGEASSLAIAKSRGWILATDDRKAIRIATEAGVPVITTPELVDRWMNSAHPTADELAVAIRGIERFARFRPRRTSPLYDWWTRLSDA